MYYFIVLEVKKPEKTLTGLKSSCQPGCIAFGSSGRGGDFFPCSFELLEAARHLWLPATPLHGQRQQAWVEFTSQYNTLTSSAPLFYI